MQLFGEKLLFQAIKMTCPKTKLPPITCRRDQKWTKIWPQKPKIGSNWTLLGVCRRHPTPKRRRFERVFDPEPKSWTKTAPKMVKRGQKWPKLGQIWVSGSRLGIFGAKGTVATPKMSQRPFSGFENWFWQGFLARGQADCRKSRFPGLVWKGWRGKFGRMIFCYKNEKSVWKFLMNEIGKNENNVIFFVTNEKYGNYFDSSLRWPILTDLSLVSLKSLMNEF